MRLILTLLPATSFLVPLDKCLQFSLEAVAGKGKGAHGEAASAVCCSLETALYRAASRRSRWLTCISLLHREVY